MIGKWQPRGVRKRLKNLKREIWWYVRVVDTGEPSAEDFQYSTKISTKKVARLNEVRLYY
jgi:hypothetical protein